MDRRVEKLKALKERAQLAGRVDSGCSAEPDHSVESEDRQCVFAGQFVGGKVWAGEGPDFRWCFGRHRIQDLKSRAQLKRDAPTVGSAAPMVQRERKRVVLPRCVPPREAIHTPMPDVTGAQCGH